MAFRDPLAICSLPAYQTFIPLSGFPPALGYCSTTSLLNERTHRNAASLYASRDYQCPVGNDYLCELLSELTASDPDFARGVWYVL